MNRTGPGGRRAVARFAVLVASGTLLIAACGGNGGSTQAGSTSSSPPGGNTAGMAGHVVTVTETEYKISLSTSTFSPGRYTFKVLDQGKATHALAIAGPGVSDLASGTVSPGGSTTLTATLQKGSYELFCPVDGHESLGMKTDITVG